MAKRKTQYTVPFQADVQTVNAVVTSWLQANGFVHKEEDGFQYYVSDNMMTGARCFEYYFQGSQIVMFGYLLSPKKPFPLDNGIVGIAQTAPYVNMIKDLTQKILQLPKGSAPNAQINANPAVTLQQPVVGAEQTAAVAAAATSFNESEEKRNGTFAIAGFIASIVCFILLAVPNMLVGGLGYVLTFWFAIMGLKSKNKKGLAIAALVLVSIAFVLGIAKFILSLWIIAN